MNAPVAYDLSRLLLRSFEPGPNGIDRVDLNLGRHFLGAENSDNCGIVLNRLRPAVIGRRGAAAFLDRVDMAWRENLDLVDDQTYHTLRQQLLNPRGPQSGRSPTRIERPPVSRTATAWRIASILLPQLAMLRPVPKQAVLLHATQFPDMNLFQWLDRRTDVKPVFFVHDLLPLRFPEYFTAQNAGWHRQFLEILVRYGCGAIVNTEVVKNDVVALLQSRSAGDKKILVAPMPAAPIFARSAPPDIELRARSYFVICGTIEPRKNHMLLLKVWQELVRREGAQAPTLVIIGRRGWNNDEVFNSLDRAAVESSHVVEVAGLTSNAMRQIMANARALLMPSYGEGYGLPIVEARAMGTPVIASDIDVFREVGGAGVTYCHHGDIAAWLDAVRTQAAAGWHSEAPMTETENRAAWQSYFQKISKFIADL